MPKTADWSPAFLTEKAFVVVNRLAAGGEVSLSDPSLMRFLAETGESVESLREELIGTRLVAMDGDRLELITLDCMTAILPTGQYVAAENSTGQLVRWIERRVREARSAGASESQ